MRLVRMPEYGLARQAGLRAEKLSAGRPLFSSIWAALLRGALHQGPRRRAAAVYHGVRPECAGRRAQCKKVRAASRCISACVRLPCAGCAGGVRLHIGVRLGYTGRCRAWYAPAGAAAEGIPPFCVPAGRPDAVPGHCTLQPYWKGTRRAKWAWQGKTARQPRAAGACIGKGHYPPL